MSKINTRTLVTLALLIAMEIVLNRFLSINAWNIKIGFSFVPIALAAMLFGPIAGGIVGAVGDFLGAILFPIGAYFPGFTLTAFCMGVIFGLFFYKQTSLVKIIVAVAINQLILGLLVNSLWISILYASPYFPLLLTRIIQCAILIPIQVIVISFMVEAIPRVWSRLNNEV